MLKEQEQIKISGPYDFKSTEAALNFGKSASGKEIKHLIVLHKMYWRKADKFREEGKGQEAFDYAFKKQLAREALEAAGINDVEKRYR
jgi:hypothetical protein